MKKMILGLILLTGFISCSNKSKIEKKWVQYTYYDTGHIIKNKVVLDRDEFGDHILIMNYTVHYDSLDNDLPYKYKPIGFILDKDTSYILDLYKKNEDINIGTIKINKIIRWKQIN